MATNYKVGEQGFENFTAAVKFAASIGAEVFEVSTGLRRWAPAPTSKKALRYHAERVAAAEAYARMKAGR